MTAFAGSCRKNAPACIPSRARSTNLNRNTSLSWRAKGFNTMPNDLQAPEPPRLAPMAAAQPPELLDFLRGKDNPFDIYVAAREPDGESARSHARGLHRDVLQPLLAVVERYRLETLQAESDLPRSGVVVILGERGSGKTHMLHVLRGAWDDGPPRLAVAAAIFEAHRPFPECLLHQLVLHLQNERAGRAA